MLASRWTLGLAALLRILLLLYGAWQDRYLDVKYTDIDYNVYSDAAAFVVQGASPYDRLTYRYAPLIAWLLIPNALLSKHWGKACLPVTSSSSRHCHAVPVLPFGSCGGMFNAVLATRQKKCEWIGDSHAALALQSFHLYHLDTGQLRYDHRSRNPAAHQGHAERTIPNSRTVMGILCTLATVSCDLCPLSSLLSHASQCPA